MSSRPDNLPPATKPIPIAGGGAGRARARSMSVSSSESGSPHSPTTPPASATSASPKINTATSPILSYFLTQSPSKTPGSFPFRKFGGPPVFEEDETDIREVPATHHVRRASTAVAERLAQPGNPSLPDAHHERGQGVMRRLSLSSAFMAPDMKRARSPPNVPPNSAVSPTSANPFTGYDVVGGKPRRSATLSAADGRPRRAPSPMGERILKGHFDGFN